MSEHRRKQPPGRGRRAAASSGRRAGPPPPPPPADDGRVGDTLSGATREQPYGSRAEARRAAQRGGRRRGGRPDARKKRFIDYPRSGYTGMRRWLPSWRQVLGSAMGFFLMMVGLVGVAYSMTDIPNANDVANAQSNTYLWADGSRMTSFGDVNRQIVPLEDIPQEVQDTVVAVENASFWDDAGIDPVGIGRAMLNMARGGDVQSGSTITQQYVKNMYLSSDQTISRKFRELLLSVRVGIEQSKEQILEGYLNTSCFGRNACGIQAASETFFKKSPDELTTGEIAFLAGQLKGPSLYDPFDPETGESSEARQQRSENRWLDVLGRRVTVGQLTEAERDAIVAEGFPEVQPPERAVNMTGQIGYLVELANNYIFANTDLDSDELAEGGYTIQTTFDQTMMDQMEAAVNEASEALDPEERPEDRYVQFGGAAVEPGDGAIRAIYGGPAYEEHYVNNADSPNVQVGSTFKPFVLAAAFRDGIRDPDGGPEQGPDSRTVVSPESMYRSEDGLVIQTYDGETLMVDDEATGEQVPWEQDNFEGNSQGDITLREATNVSANSPFVQLGMDIGPDTVAEAAMDAGLLEDSLGPHGEDVPTFALGVSHPGPIRMATAYSTFAASGEQNEPYSVSELRRGDTVVLDRPDSPTQAFESDVADTVTNMLEGVIQDGSGSRAADIGFPAAGKTGTTDDNKSAWFVGYSSELSTAIGMWRQADSEEDIYEGDDVSVGQFLEMYETAGLPKITGGSLPLTTWMSFMSAASNGEEQEFPEPPDDLGTIVWDEQAESPTPSPTETEDPTDEPTQEEESEEPTDEPTDEPTTEEPPPPSPTETCGDIFNPCSDGGATGDPGGADQGTTGEPGGADQGTTGEPGGTTEGTPGGPEGTDRGADGGNGGIF
ncbi:transglycosylase domain-containing protein [Streptomyces avicenniae]|uniref:transglycosylase domain-containing protein n=1 Tax=Streptomyces avicenniae TaxID=500153 RepID=UPI000A43311C|nr:transglycosylase domain-containing protein [Streptomyces avicenniae]